MKGCAPASPVRSEGRIDRGRGSGAVREPAVEAGLDEAEEDELQGHAKGETGERDGSGQAHDVSVGCRRGDGACRVRREWGVTGV